MKNKFIFISILLIWSIGLLFFALNQYIHNTFGLNLIQYYKDSKPLTKSELAYLEKKGEINFVSDKNAPPFTYVDAADGQYKGLTLDYANALSMVLGIKVNYIPKEWDEAVSSLESGAADVCDMFSSPEREQRFSFSNSIYLIRGIIATGKDSDIDSFGDLSGKRVAVPSGDYAVEYVEQRSKTVTIVKTNDVASALELLLDHQVDAVIGDEPVIFHLLKQKKAENKINILSPMLYEKDVSLAVGKDDAVLLDVLNKGIFRLKQQNLVQNIQQKWFGLSASISKNQIPSRLLLGISFVVYSLVIIIAVSMIHSHNLKTQVRKRTKDLYKSRQDIQMIIDALSAYLVVISTDGTITNANNAFCSWVETEKTRVIGSRHSEFAFISHIFNTCEIDNIRDEIRIKERLKYKEKYFLTSVLWLADNEQMLIVADDITDQVANQQQLLQDNKMIAIGQLAAGVAHEIRNPLGNIRNYNYILKNRLSYNDPTVEQCFSIIESSVEKAGDIINNLLNFSRIEDSGWQSRNLRELIDSIIYLERKELEGRNIEIEINCSSSLVVSTKPESMNHILLNLISNSKDAMPDGGKITITCLAEQSVLYMYFADNGTGMEEEIAEQVFNPFFTTKKKGTGLGLYILYNEVVKIGGTVKVESFPGKGTVFRFRFADREDRNNG